MVGVVGFRILDLGFRVWDLRLGFLGLDFRAQGFFAFGLEVQGNNLAYFMNCLANSLSTLVISPSPAAAPSAAAHAHTAATTMSTTAVFNGKFMVCGLAGVVRAGVCSIGQRRRILAGGGKEWRRRRQQQQHCKSSIARGSTWHWQCPGP